MITVKQFLTAAGLETPYERIKLVRHVDHVGKPLGKMIEDGEFDFYQAEQLAEKKPFHDCEVIVSFLGDPDGGCTLHGVYRVIGCRNFTSRDLSKAPDFLKSSLTGDKRRIWYELEEMQAFEGLRGRVRARWGAAIVWVQKKDVEVFEVLPPGRTKSFPGYQNVILSWRELRAICLFPDSHRDWVTALKFTAAIYRIVDLSTGMIYIGSAYGRHGLWNRFRHYARTGHGDNKKLIGLDFDKFQWSIVRTLSGVMSERDVILLEQMEKQKHGSRAVGLNAN